MANIRNYISLQDRMTPVFRTIIKSMDSTLRVMRQMDRQANNGVQSKAYKRAQRDIQRSNNELIRMQNNLARCDREAGNLARSTKNVSFTAAGSGLSLFLTGLSSALYLIKNISTALSNLMETPDAMSAIKYRLETYDTTEATGSQLMNAVYKTAQDSRSDLKSTADLAARILVSGATKGSGGEAINLAGILNKASFLGGSSSQESQRALLQLSQGLASGQLQGDELRAIREQSPGLTDTLAKGLSKLAEEGALPEKFLNTTMGDLKKLGSEGELTSGRIIAAFKTMEDYVDETFENSPKQFGQAVTGILNVWKRWLGFMGEGDNALARINKKAWQMLEWFESPAGEEFFINLANGVNFIVEAIFQLIDCIGDCIRWFNNLENSSEILQSALITLGVVMAGAALVGIISFVILHWKILLVIAAIGLIVYAFMAMGATAGEVIGGIIGGVAFLVQCIYDAIIWIIVAVAWVCMAAWDLILAFVVVVVDLIVGIVTVVIWALQFIVQLVLWVLTIIDGALITIYNIIYSIVMGAYGIIKGAIVAVYAIFVGLAEGVLGIIWGIAAAIDAVFGSNLADTVEGWMKGLGDSVVELEAKLDPNGEFEKIGDQWKDSYSYLGDRFTGKNGQEDWSTFDEMAKTYEGAYNIIDGVNGALFDAGFDDEFSVVGQWGLDNTVNPLDGWEWGMGIGEGLDSAIGDFSMMMNELGEDGLLVNGGELDSIGSIGSDVDISDEDLQLLRDVAARDFLLTLQTSTPQVNNNFGDIRETADVGKILEVIQDMVDEQLAVSLVVE